MTSHPENDTRPDVRRRYLLPAGIFVSVPHRKPVPDPFEDTRRMLRHPGFWAIMLALTVLMVIGALLLSEHLRSSVPLPAPNTGRVYYALLR